MSDSKDSKGVDTPLPSATPPVTPTSTDDDSMKVFIYDYYDIKDICGKLTYDDLYPYDIPTELNLQVLLMENYVTSVIFDISYGGKYKVKIDFSTRKRGGILYAKAVHWVAIFLRLPISRDLFHNIQSDCTEWVRGKTLEQIRETYHKRDMDFEIGDCLDNKVLVDKIIQKINDDGMHLTIITRGRQ